MKTVKLELQITQTRHPKSVADGWTNERTNKQTNGQTEGGTDGRSGLTTRPALAKATQVKIKLGQRIKDYHPS